MHQCDEKKPTCARCLRLKIPCVGSGQVRFKFQEEKQYSTRAKKHHDALTSESSSDTLSEASSQSPPQTIFAISPPKKKQQAPADEINFQVLAPGSLQPLPSNDLGSLAGAFISTIKRSTDLRYNLWWSFGQWLEDVPRRLGTNEALDRAVDTLTCAHSNFSCNRSPSVETLSRHSAALRTLRVYLDDQIHAQSSSTLCAVMVLMVCQVFLGPTRRKFTGHVEGAAAILKARKDFGPRDPFEARLFLSMRGTVVRLLPFSLYLLPFPPPFNCFSCMVHAYFRHRISYTNDITSYSKAYSTTESISPRKNGRLLSEMITIA